MKYPLLLGLIFLASCSKELTTKENISPIDSLLNLAYQDNPVSNIYTYDKDRVYQLGDHILIVGDPGQFWTCGDGTATCLSDSSPCYLILIMGYENNPGNEDGQFRNGDLIAVENYGPKVYPFKSLRVSNQTGDSTAVCIGNTGIALKWE